VLLRAQATLKGEEFDDEKPIDYTYLGKQTKNDFHSAFAKARMYSLAHPISLNPDRDEKIVQQAAIVKAAAEVSDSPTANTLAPEMVSFHSTTGSSRINCFEQWANSGNWDFKAPLKCKTEDYDFEITS
jgi:hypothetical protein